MTSGTSANDLGLSAGRTSVDALPAQPRSVSTYALIIGCVLLVVEAGLTVHRIRTVGIRRAFTDVGTTPEPFNYYEVGPRVSTARADEDER
jgi:hypothetical protein